MAKPAEPTLVLRPGRERSLRRRHPWIFAGAVAEVTGAPDAGDVVAVRSAGGELLGRASFEPGGGILARVWTFPDADGAVPPVDDELVVARLEAAVAARAPLDARTDAVRWVHAESDLLPGLVVDRYGALAVCHVTCAGAAAHRDAAARWLAGRPEIAAVVERTDRAGRRRPSGTPALRVLAGDPPDGPVAIHEAVPATPPGPAPPDPGDRSGGSGRSDGRSDRWTFDVDVATGQKTGFYLDQRDSRQVVAGFAAGRRVLDLFGYTGGFSVAAAWGGATTVTTVDSSAPALALAAANLAANGLPPAELVTADVFTDLRSRRDAGETYDLIVVDPPKLAHAEAEVRRATRAYKDLNWLACRLLAPGGVLLTFSCSGAVDAALFQKVVFGAALDARVDLQLIGRLGQPADHPVLLSVPETEYLKGLVCRRPD